MPELPEVETVLNGIKPHLEGAAIHEVIVRQPKLRWPIVPNFHEKLVGQTVGELSRRGKYLLIPVGVGTVIIHLGMSGYLSIMNRDEPPLKHSHVDIVFSPTHVLRYTDARRFGCILWTEASPFEHALLKPLGPEPLSEDFSSDYLYQVIQNRTVAIKNLIMNSHVVVGVGNIYAAEALFMAGIHPLMPAKHLMRDSCERLVDAIRDILQVAIKQGGTTVRDFMNSEGKPGYFVQKLKVYGREGLPCTQCKAPLDLLKIGQRSTVFCKVCQQI